jgi:hypothetical protein
VLESACRQLASWNDHASTRHLRLAVNVSALQFMQPDFVDRLLDLLILGAFDPSNLTNGRDFPVPSKPRPVRVAVYGTAVPRWRGKSVHQLTYFWKGKSWQS